MEWLVTNGNRVNGIRISFKIIEDYDLYIILGLQYLSNFLIEDYYIFLITFSAFKSLY